MLRCLRKKGFQQLIETPMTAIASSSACSFVSVESLSALAEEQPFDKVDIVIIICISYWNPFFRETAVRFQDELRT